MCNVYAVTTLAISDLPVLPVTTILPPLRMIHMPVEGKKVSRTALILFPIGQAYAGHNADLASAVANLAILTGKLGKEGCGVLCMAEKNNSQGAVDMGFYARDGGMNGLQIIDACAVGGRREIGDHGRCRRQVDFRPCLAGVGRPVDAVRTGSQDLG